MPNQVAIVTGAAHPSGIGYAIASRLKADGHTVVTVDLEGADHDVDVTDKSQIECCIREIVQAHGRLDILVNNAGIAEGSARFLEQTGD
ncbi:MAG: SDR family oxidoreductase [Candidatus Azotimanducaceae bacterium]